MDLTGGQIREPMPLRAVRFILPGGTPGPLAASHVDR